MKQKLLTFQQLFNINSSVRVNEVKMFPISKIWEGMKPIMKEFILLHYGRPSLVLVKTKMCFHFITKIVALDKRHGSLYTVKYLKACFVCLQRYLGDDLVTSLREIDKEFAFPRLINGLPNIIPKTERTLIRSHHPSVVRFWLSLFSIYRVLQCEHKYNLSSITNPFSGNKEYLNQLHEGIEHSPLLNHFKALPGFKDWFSKVNLYPSHITMIQTSSPSNGKSWQGMGTDLLLLRRTGISYFFDEYAKLVGNKYINSVIHSVMNLLDSFYNELSKDKTLEGHAKMDPAIWLPSTKASASGEVGQLAFKEEAAGKLRIFAIVDFWTQNLLRPLHDCLFDLLKRIPNDGTFDQDASVKRSVSKSQVSGRAWSFDLSSATDRLPVSIQYRLLDMILPIKVGKPWANLLVSRWYHVPEYGSNMATKVRYAVGQPMGALSSWAMLAVTHHFLVQHCSFLLGRRGWEENYEILGDDLVIFDIELAEEYLKITKELGMDINLSKSIVSPNLATFEFAKRTILNGINVSAISVKQLIDRSLPSRMNNILFFSKLGLVSNNIVLANLMTRFGFKSFKDLNVPLISLLGYLFKINRITPNDILKVVINPMWEDEPLLEQKINLPYQSLITLLRKMLNDPEIPFEIPKSEEREGLAEENEEILADTIVLTTLDKAKTLEELYYSYKASVDSVGILGSWIIKDRDILWNQSDVLFDIIDNFEGFDPSELVDDIEKVAIRQAKIHHLSIEKALLLHDKVDSLIRKWSFAVPKEVKKAKVGSSLIVQEKISPIFNFININLGGKMIKNYWRNRPVFS